MFEGLKMAADLIKSGINSYKACEKMDTLVEKTQTEFKSKLKPADLALYTKFKKAKEKEENAPETLSDEEKTALTDAKEAAEFLYLSSLTRNGALPAELKNEILGVLKEYKDSSPEEIFERSMMRYAKTPEEKETIQQFINEAK